MTNMLHKSVEARRTRNGRYKAAINPVRAMFGCTAAQAAGKIAGVVNDNARLTTKLEKVEAENAVLGEALKKAKGDGNLYLTEIALLGTSLDETRSRVKELEIRLAAFEEPAQIVAAS